MKRVAIKLALSFVVFLLIGAAIGIYTDIHGNPISKQKAEKNIISYVIDTYGTNNFSVADVNYDREHKEYGAVVEFIDSEDTVFYVAYSPKDNKIKDTFNETVKNGYNTFIRLNAEYGRIVANALAEYYGAENVMYYGELGKNQPHLNFGDILFVDMPFDMYNLPLEATVSVFLDREDASAEQFAEELISLQKYMYSKEIAVDYYDMMYNGTVLLEDFPSSVVVEYLEDEQSLSKTISEFIN